MKTSKAQLEASRAYTKKCVYVHIRINPEREPVAAGRLLALKQSGTASSFFKGALNGMNEHDWIKQGAVKNET